MKQMDQYQNIRASHDLEAVKDPVQTHEMDVNVTDATHELGSDLNNESALITGDSPRKIQNSALQSEIGPTDKSIIDEQVRISQT